MFLIFFFGVRTKVIANLGLCVSVYDIQEIGKGFIFPGDGASTYTVRMACIVKLIVMFFRSILSLACLFELLYSRYFLVVILMGGR